MGLGSLCSFCAALCTLFPIECVDMLDNCALLDERFCATPFDEVAREACALRCGLCEGLWPILF